MSDDILSIFSLSLKPENFPAFRELVAEIVAVTRQEPGTLTYEYSVSADQRTVHIVERYRPEGLVPHIDVTFAPYAKRFLDLVTVTGLVVYGTPDAEARKRLDGFGAVYMTPFDGFTR